jgi:rubrerythrin
VAIAFYGNELINIAIGIERQGIAFYDGLARSTKRPKAREVFQYLAGMERAHVKIFQGMLADSEKAESPGTYTGDYAAYLQALANSAVFTDELMASDLATRAESDTAAVDLGIRAEKDSILFYYEMQELMPSGSGAEIKRIIAEEKGHLAQLTELKTTLAS